MSTLTLALLGLLASGPAPVIQTLQPAAALRPGTTEILVTGRHLADLQSVVFGPTTGISAHVASHKPGMARVVVTTTSATPLGPCDLRLVTPRGVSNALPLYISKDPVFQVRAAEGKLTRIPGFPIVLTGAIERPQQGDRVQFEGRARRPVTFHVSAASLGSMLEPAVTVEGGDRRTLAWEDVGHDGDVSLRFTPDHDGVYDLKIRDLRHRGGRAFTYRIHGAEESATPAAPGATSPATPGATTLAVPGEVSGCIARPGESHTIGFEVGKKQRLVLRVDARSAGSAMDALLAVHDAAGKRIAVNDDHKGPDPRLQLDLGPGAYTAEVTDVAGHGGPDHRYTLIIGPPNREAPSFAVRFLPDAARVSRGSHRKLWCQATRTGGFKGQVQVTFPDLPPGVTASPVTLGPDNGWTSVFTLGATTEAALGSVPIAAVATGRIGDRSTRVHCVPEGAGGDRTQAYITVLPAPAVTVAALGPPSEDDQRKHAAQLENLRTQLNERREEDSRALKAWKDRLAAPEPTWRVLKPQQATSAKGSTMSILDDGSVLATGAKIPTDTYTVTLETGAQELRALRLEVLTDERLPRNGPGRNSASGNFVLSEITVTATPGGDGAAPAPVKLTGPTARFSQDNYPVASSVDGNTGTGWAVYPQEGRDNWAVFDLQHTLQAGPRTRLTVTLDQQHGSDHLLGRFRLSAASARLPGDGAAWPEAVVTAARSPQPTAEQQRFLAEYFHEHVNERLGRIREHIHEIESGFGGSLEITQLERVLKTDTPELTAARRAWEEQQRETMVRWVPATVTALRSEHGVEFEEQAQHVVRARTAVAPKDTYTVELATDVSPITGIRLEALADKTLPGGGPGLAVNGNFVLSSIQAWSWPRGGPEASRPHALHQPQASFQQQGFPIGHTLDGNPATGWAISQNMGKDCVATWRLKAPATHTGATVLRLVLDHQTVHLNHLIGRFRVSVTSNPKPGLPDPSVPADIPSILFLPESERSPSQQDRIAEYHRSVATELTPTRERLMVLRARQAPFPPRVARGKKTRLAAQVTRAAGFDGPVKISLEGFVSGRDGKGRPKTIGGSIKAPAVTAEPGRRIVVLQLDATKNAELGTRNVVLRAEGKVGGETVVEYGLPFPLQVTK